METRHSGTAQRKLKAGDRVYMVVDRRSQDVSVPGQPGPGRVVVRHVDVVVQGRDSEVRKTPKRGGSGARSDGQAEAMAGLLVLGEEDVLARLAEHLTPEQIPEAAVVLQARRNAEWRAQFAKTYGLLTAAEVADLSGSQASNRGALASRLARDRIIFGVPYKSNRILYPGFQFCADGTVHPAIAPLLQRLTHAGLDGWELASWFTSASDLLDGDAPVDRFDDLDGVLAAADDESAPVGF